MTLRNPGDRVGRARLGSFLVLCFHEVWLGRCLVRTWLDARVVTTRLRRACPGGSVDWPLPPSMFAPLSILATSAAKRRTWQEWWRFRASLVAVSLRSRRGKPDGGDIFVALSGSTRIQFAKATNSSEVESCTTPVGLPDGITRPSSEANAQPGTLSSCRAVSPSTPCGSAGASPSQNRARSFGSRIISGDSSGGA